MRGCEIIPAFIEAVSAMTCGYGLLRRSPRGTDLSVAKVERKIFRFAQGEGFLDTQFRVSGKEVSRDDTRFRCYRFSTG